MSNNSYLFTHIKGARTDHIIALRAHHSKKCGEGLPPLNPDELKPHSAQHTLQFIEDEYVEKVATRAGTARYCQYRSSTGSFCFDF